MGLKRSKSFEKWLSRPVVGRNGCLALTIPTLPVLVVGAGPAGLAAMAGLKQAGVSFEGVEGHSRVGGIWDQSNPISSVYDGLRTNTSRHTTHLGMPMSSSWPNYPTACQTQSYLADFARQKQVDSRIQFSTRFVETRKSPRGTWITTLRNAANEQSIEREYRAVVFATGVHHQERQVMPRQLWDESVEAGLRTLHSSQYRCAAEFAGKRVLIIGAGNSATDIADIISQTALRTVVAVRSTPWLMPSVVFGRPSDRVAERTGSWQPYWLQLASFFVAQRLFCGHPRKLGFDAPQHRLLDKFATTDRGFVRAIREGRIAVRSQVTSLKNGVATFAKADHLSESFDVVIFATGYRRCYPMLDAPTNGHSLADHLSFLIFHQTEPGLAYMAETIATRGWIFAEQGQAIAAYYAAEQDGRQNVAAFNARRSLPSPDFKGKMFSKADGFHVDYHLYKQSLLDLSNWLAS